MGFGYRGPVEFQSWEGEKPITLWWRLAAAVHSPPAITRPVSPSPGSDHPPPRPRLVIRRRPLPRGRPRCRLRPPRPNRPAPRRRVGQPGFRAGFDPVVRTRVAGTRPDERAALTLAIEQAKQIIERDHRSDGYNIGFNVGVAAGQTIWHLHVHLIPRYAGDVTHPRGGIRQVIPGRGDYQADSARSSIEPGLPHGRALIAGGTDDPLLPHLVTHLDRALAVDIAVAFVFPGGVARLEPHLNYRVITSRDREGFASSSSDSTRWQFV